MFRALVVRGFGVGAVGGLLAFIFARIFAEPLIQAAIDYESARAEAVDKLARAAGGTPAVAGPDIVNRTLQADVGSGVGMILFGAAVGGLFAVAFVLAYGRTGNLRPRNLALAIAGVAFGTLYLVPFLKYPANPPAIGHVDTIGDRTGLYLVMVLASVGFALLAVAVGQRLSARLGNYSATLVALACFAVLSAAVMLALPPLGHLQTNLDQYGNLLTETPRPLRDPAGTIVFPGFDPDLLYQFRLYSVLAQVILWGVIGLAFGPLAAKVLGQLTQRDVDRSVPA